MRRVILAICSTAAGLALLLSFKTHTQSALVSGTSAAALGAPATGDGGVPSSTGQASAAATGSATASATAGASAAKTVTGDAVATMYGPVQVQITVKAGKITAVKAVEYPQGTPRDYQINAYAIPQLNSEALSAGSASIDGISGATFTSQGYIGSLQSAVDKAGL